MYWDSGTTFSYRLNKTSIMRIAFVLVVFLGLALADSVRKFQQMKSVSPESKNDVGAAQNAVANPATKVAVHRRKLIIRKHKGKKRKKNKKDKKNLNAILKKILKHINKVTSQTKKKVINLAKKFKLEISKVSRIRKKNKYSDAALLNITHLVESKGGAKGSALFSLGKRRPSDAELLDIEQQQVASQGYAQLSAQVLMDTISKTVTRLKKLVENGAKNIKDLSTLFLGHIKEFANSSTGELHAARKTGKVVKRKEFQMIDKLSKVCKRKLLQSYSISEKQVMDLAHTGGVSILEAADNETKTFDVFTADDEKLKGFVKFVLRKLYESAKDIAGKYIELASGCLKSLKNLALNADKTVKRLAVLEIKSGQDVVMGKVTSSKTKETVGGNLTAFDDKNTREFKKLIGSITVLVKSVLERASKEMDVIRKCTPIDPTCVVH